MPKSAPEVFATLFSCYQPVENYLRQRADALQPAPTVVLTAVDTFVLSQILSYASVPPTVLDLASDATAGASAVVWATQPHLIKAVAPLLGWSKSDRSWRITFAEAVASSVLSPAVLTLMDDWHSVLPVMLPTEMWVVLWAPVGTEPPELEAQLAAIYRFAPQALVCVLPVGFIGQSAVLPCVLNYCAQHQLRVWALREVSPFLAQSQLGLICPTLNAEVPVMLERLRLLFDGNFQFLSLAKQVVQGALSGTAGGQERLPERVMRLQHEVDFMRRSKAWRFAVAYWQFRNTVRRLLGLP